MQVTATEDVQPASSETPVAAGQNEDLEDAKCGPIPSDATSANANQHECEEKQEEKQALDHDHTVTMHKPAAAEDVEDPFLAAIEDAMQHCDHDPCAAIGWAVRHTHALDVGDVARRILTLRKAPLRRLCMSFKVSSSGGRRKLAERVMTHLCEVRNNLVASSADIASGVCCAGECHADHCL